MPNPENPDLNRKFVFTVSRTQSMITVIGALNVRYFVAKDLEVPGTIGLRALDGHGTEVGGCLDLNYSLASGSPSLGPIDSSPSFCMPYANCLGGRAAFATFSHAAHFSIQLQNGDMGALEDSTMVSSKGLVDDAAFELLQFESSVHAKRSEEDEQSQDPNGSIDLVDSIDPIDANASMLGRVTNVLRGDIEAHLGVLNGLHNKMISAGVEPRYQVVSCEDENISQQHVSLLKDYRMLLIPDFSSKFLICLKEVSSIERQQSKNRRGPSPVLDADFSVQGTQAVLLYWPL